MNLFGQIPFLRLLLPFIAGTVLFVFSIDTIDLTYFFFVISPFLLMAVIFASFYTPLHLQYGNRWIYGLLLSVVFFAGGYLIVSLSTGKLKKDYFGAWLPEAQQNITVIADVNETPVNKDKSMKAELVIRYMKTGEGWRKVTGNAIGYFEKNAAVTGLNYGDRLLLKAAFQLIPPPQNPGEFNYKRYLSYHSVYHRVYLRSGSWKITERRKGNPVLYNAVEIRNKLLQILKKNNLSGDEFAVASALLLGYEEEINPALLRAYSAAGALHVLSVSGLHVGIIYLALEWLLSFFKKIPYYKIWKPVIVILFLWFYALITGLTPSVLRSSAMLSFVVIGRNFKHQSGVYNSITVSAFLLLLFNPYLIFEVGFQLSYLAVLGIVLIHPHLYSLWEPPNRFIDKIWGITTISISAQAATFPLGLLYFHQFPNYFIFSNLVVIPASTIIIFGGIFVLLSSPVHTICSFLAKLLVLCLKFLNWSVIFIEQLPGSIITGISTTIFETWLLYFLIAFLFVFFVLKKEMSLKFSLYTIIILLFSQCAETAMTASQKKIIVYNIPGAAAYDFIDGNQNVFYTDSALAVNESKLLFYVHHNWWDMNLNNTSFKSIDYSGNRLFQFYNLRIAIILKPFSFKSVQKKLKVDYLILGKNAPVSLFRLQKIYAFKTLIIDSSNNAKSVKRWKAQAKTLGIHCVAVTDDGAFVYEI